MLKLTMPANMSRVAGALLIACLLLAVPGSASLAGQADLAAGNGDPIEELVAAVDENLWYGSVFALSNIMTRYTLTAGNVAARDWIEDRFQDYGLPVALDPFPVSGGTSYNVIGELTGRTRPDDIVIVGAHFDSTSQIPQTLAPGAEDNASGTAAVIEMARILKDHPPEATIRFIAFSGEEQGLVGSTHYVATLSPGERSRIQGAVLLDMIGYTGDQELDVLLETYAWAEPLRAVLRTAAAEWTELVSYDSDNPFGSDHMPFLNQGIPALLLIENEWDSYPCYHNTCDTHTQLSKDQGREMMKMLVVALAELAGTCHLSDTDCSGRVSILDVQTVAAHWNSNNGEPDFDHRWDLTHDGQIDLDDILLVALDWGWM